MSKYLLYAIGEIVLVVIGILIAISVAEWKGNVNDRKTEQRLLYELDQGIKSDMALVEMELAETNLEILRLKELSALLKGPVPDPSEHLNHLFGTVYGIKFLDLNMALYEDLKAFGFGIVQDEKLRSQIISLFENDYAKIEGLLMNETSVNQVNRPYYLSNFVSIRFSEYAKPMNIDNLWEDNYYENIVYYRLVTLELNQKVFYEDAIKGMNLLLRLIEKNLKVN